MRSPSRLTDLRIHYCCPDREEMNYEERSPFGLTDLHIHYYYRDKEEKEQGVQRRQREQFLPLPPLLP